MLEDVEEKVGRTGPLGAAYLSQVLLSKQTGLSPQLENMRQIASRFAIDDANTGSTLGYSGYIKALSLRLASNGFSSMNSLFHPHPYAETSGILEYDLLAAAAYMGKFSIARELSAKEGNMGLDYSTMGQPQTAAAIAENTAIIDLFLQQTKLHGSSVGSVLQRQLKAASRVGSVRVVEHLLASEFNPGLGHKRDHPYFEGFHEALSTPNVEVFDILMRYKETTLANNLKRHKERYSGKKETRITPLMEAQLAPLTEAELAPLLHEAAENGWESMASRLLDMGAPADGYSYCRGHDEHMPLLAACKSGSEGVVRILLQHNANITGLEMEAAAKKGRIGTVRILLEHFADSNRGKTPPIVSAVKLEYKEMFHLLLDHGAELGEAGLMAAKEARKEGLDSMLALLEQHGVSIGDGLVAEG